MIVVMLHLKKKYSIEEDDCGDTWKDVESDYDDNSLEIV
jgi:hypothetical protein